MRNVFTALFNVYHAYQLIIVHCVSQIITHLMGYVNLNVHHYTILIMPVNHVSLALNIATNVHPRQYAHNA